MEDNSYQPHPFILNCNFWKILKQVPGIITIFSHPVGNFVKDEETRLKILGKLVRKSQAGKADLDEITSITYYSSLQLSKTETAQFVKDFKSRLNSDQFSEYQLSEEADNLLLLVLYLYDNFWDHEGSSYNTYNAFKNLPDIEYKDKPKDYLDMIKAKELAAFIKACYSDDPKANLVLIRGKEHSIVKDNNMNDYLKTIILNGLIDGTVPISSLIQTFGEQGLGLILMLKQEYDDVQRKALNDSIDYILNYKLENPFPQRNKDISYICLVLRQYLAGTGIMGTTEKLLSEDHLRLFAEILNLFQMKFSDKEYQNEDYRDNLAVTIRNYLKEQRTN